MTSQNLFSTRIPKLDEALRPHLSPGNFILVAGLTGGGKTILAGQLGAEFACAGHGVHLISTHTPQNEWHARIISAFGEIPYAKIKDSIKTVQIPGPGKILSFPDPDAYGWDAAEKSLPLFEALSKNLFFEEVESLGFSPKDRLEGIVDGHARKNGTHPTVIILDHLSSPRIGPREEFDPFRARKAVMDAAAALADLARRRGILVIAFCQANQSLLTSKRIVPSDIREFKSIYDYADAFIGISRCRREDVDVSGTEGDYNRVQDFTIQTRMKPSPAMVPVVTNFGYQRFDPHSDPVLDQYRSDQFARFDRHRSH